jgi:hypothetical protein
VAEVVLAGQGDALGERVEQLAEPEATHQGAQLR